MACPTQTPRPVQGVTIDASTSLDLDDGILVQPHPAGGWRAWVTIAAVAAAVPLHSLEDVEARARVATRYLPTTHRSMLSVPTERRTSLAPHRTRAGLTLEVHVDPAGEVTHAELYPTSFDSIARLSYVDVPAILATADQSPIRGTLAAARDLAEVLLHRRRRLGALALYDLHHGWVVDEDGRVHKVAPDRSTIGYVIVQELMILANAEMAKLARANSVPILYRVHTARAEGPSRESLAAALAGGEGLSLDDLNRLAAHVDHQLERARYSAEPSAHWGLALPLYAHVTSPIRRYADLVTQRQLWAFVHEQPLPYTVADLAVVAAHIQRVLTEREDRAQAHAAASAAAGGAALLQHATGATLARLDDTRFERVLKVAVRLSGEDCTAVLGQAIDERIRLGRLPVLCMVVALLEPPTTPGWQQVRESVLAHLADHPEHAPSILATATSLELLPAVTRDVEPNGSQGPFTAVSSLAMDSGVRTSPPVTSPRKKTALALADVALLAVLCGLPSPLLSSNTPTPSPTPKPATKPRVDPSKHPISMLLEIAQAVGSQPAVFDVVEVSPQRFRSECRFVIGGVKGMARGEGTSKAAAKTEAAREALAWLTATGVVEGAPISPAPPPG